MKPLVRLGICNSVIRMKQNQVSFEEVHIISEMEKIFIQVIIRNPKSTIVNNSIYSLCYYKAVRSLSNLEPKVLKP